jgi:PKD repeat protein
MKNMDKPKWYSKLIHMAVVLSVLLSLMGLAVLPVAAQGPVLDVTVDTDADEYCVCENFTVTATIRNTGNETAQNVSALLSWTPPSGANLVSGDNPRDVGNVTTTDSIDVTWTLHCNATGPLTITVNATELVFTRMGSTDEDSKVVDQWGLAELTARIFTPEEGDTFTECENFPLKFEIENTGTAPALHVSGTIFPSANVNVVGLPCGNAYTTGTLPRLDPGETFNFSANMHCCGCDVPPLVSSIHVIPNGDDFCTLQQIEDCYTFSDIVRTHQTYNVTCDAEPNPSKVCHNVTFTATLGHCAVPPIDWTWDFGDGSDPVSGNSSSLTIPAVSHHYNISGNWTAVIDVIDSNNVTGTCNVTVEVFPPLDASCNVTPFDFTKTDEMCSHNLTFQGTAVGGFPGNMCNYTWEWDFGDNSTPATGTGYSSGPVPYCYNETGNYTAVFTIGDDCLNNTANCTINITVFEPLDVLCSVSSNVTKVCHNVTFNGTVIGGIPDGWEGCGYNWEWDFGDGTTETGSCLYHAQSVSHHYNASGNYCATFNITDNCWNNTANCTVCVEVHPGLNLTCYGHDSTVCNAVNFTATLTGGVPNSTFNWTWDFGDPFDPTPAHTQNATHTYMCTGNYTATVTVCDDLEPANCANCTVNVTITIEPPELYWPGNGSTVTVGCNNTVCLEWEDIGCCNYTVLIWKEIIGEKVWTVHTGKDAFACIELFDLEGGWKWQVIAVDVCGEWVASDVWHFDVERDCMYADVTVTRPNGGETFTCNTTEMITWDVTEYGTLGDGLGIDQGDLTIDLYYTTGTGIWTPIAMGEDNDGAYEWFVPEENSNQCLVMVRATDGQGNVGIDVSDSVFTIECAPPPTTCTTLYEGWNLYSTQLIPDNTDITNVTAAINNTVILIYAYNTTSGGFLYYAPGDPFSTLTTMEAGLGYWVYMNMTDTLCIVGQPLPDPPTIPPTYPVVPGWNLLGFKSTVPMHHSTYLASLWSGGFPNYSVIWDFDGSVDEYINIFPAEENGGMLQPGHGFWLWATAAGEIVPTS